MQIMRKSEEIKELKKTTRKAKNQKKMHKNYGMQNLQISQRI